MKAQLAMMEVLMSSVVLSTLVSLLTCTLYTSPSAAGAYNPNYGNLVYDFVNLLYQNETMAKCFQSGNLTCETKLLIAAKEVYGMDYVEFSNAGAKVSCGNRLSCKRSALECMPMAMNGTILAACLYACGA